MKVIIPSALRSYTGEKNEVSADGATLCDVLADLDNRYPGIRFRMLDEQHAIRRHIKVFINQAQAMSLDEPLEPSDKVLIVCALSGG